MKGGLHRWGSGLGGEEVSFFGRSVHEKGWERGVSIDIRWGYGVLDLVRSWVLRDVRFWVWKRKLSLLKIDAEDKRHDAGWSGYCFTIKVTFLSSRSTLKTKDKTQEPTEQENFVQRLKHLWGLVCIYTFQSSHRQDAPPLVSYRPGFPPKIIVYFVVVKA